MKSRAGVGGCGPLIANGDVSIENGGTQAIVSAGAATVGRGAGAGIAIASLVRRARR